MQALLSEPYRAKCSVDAWSASELARLGVQVLRDEVLLTPKPGLVDQHGNGSHHDMTLPLMLASADALGSAFHSIAETAHGRPASAALREELGALGRAAEANMLDITGGVNTHRGAIWALGLLIAGCAAVGDGGSIEETVAVAAALAAIPDISAPDAKSHGAEVRRRFNVQGAKQEACDGFPHATRYGLPALLHARRMGASENQARILSLLAIMSTLDDTCLLYRAGPALLQATKQMAAKAYLQGGTRTPQGRACIKELDDLLRSAWASPGGSADLLAVTLFLDRYSSLSAQHVFSSEEVALCKN